MSTPKKRLEICPKCGGYMVPESTVKNETKRHWKDETKTRSFGGVALLRFVCESCHHEEIYQVDQFAHLVEDD